MSAEFERAIDQVDIHPAQYGNNTRGDDDDYGWEHNKRPLVLFFDHYTHPNTGNELISGIDLDALSPKKLNMLFGPTDDPGRILEYAFSAGDGRIRKDRLERALDAEYGPGSGEAVLHQGGTKDYTDDGGVTEHGAWRTWLADLMRSRGTIGVDPDSMRRVVDRLQDQSEETGREYTLKDVRDAYVKKHGERSYVPKIDADDIEYEVPDEYAEFEKKEIDLSDLYDVEEVEEPDVDVEAEFEPDTDLETGEVDVEFASDEEVEDALEPEKVTEPEVPEPEEEPIEPEEPEVEIEFPEEDTLDLADELEDEFEEEPPEPTDDISDLVNKALHDHNLESREHPETDTEGLADVVNRAIQHGVSDEVPKAADETEEAVEADETEEAADTINDILGDENEEEVDDIINRILDGQ